MVCTRRFAHNGRSVARLTLLRNVTDAITLDVNAIAYEICGCPFFCVAMVFFPPAILVTLSPSFKQHFL